MALDARHGREMVQHPRGWAQGVGKLQGGLDQIRDGLDLMQDGWYALDRLKIPGPAGKLIHRYLSLSRERRYDLLDWENDVEAVEDLLPLFKQGSEEMTQLERQWGPTIKRARGRWDQVIKLERGGHRLFHSPTDGRWAIADNSGRTPETTDDGILWVVLGQDLVIDQKSKGVMVDVYAEDRGNRLMRTVVGWDGAIKLAETLRSISVTLKTREGRTFDIV